ncbi:hypothetical protein BDP55DRAFT_697829 [Colletotrichum godetiae]|uniref:DNA polymerase n=1 Tax=Colletotrichum godetiae TaxID=1209918 RepID=A0AAJ0AE28_9PEZI|nr:uncharacterized protein BDP55DRAFT_697829 [Colletotrichum godetiae]KAK1659260.1 hypothetical protein BDP55DRAFT_697829 [Colletotrichum godetiae]
MTELDFPLIYLLPTHLEADQLHELEGKIPSLTYDIREAEIIVGNIFKRERALFELRRKKVQTDPVDVAAATDTYLVTSRKRKRASSGSDSDSTLYTEDGERFGPGTSQLAGTSSAHERVVIDANTVKVVKLAWLRDSFAQSKVLPLHDYILYEGIKKDEDRTSVTVRGSDILSRAATDSASQIQGSLLPQKKKQAQSPSETHRSVPCFIRQTTSEHDSMLELPPVPQYLRTSYACQRSTPVDLPNAAFVDGLKTIRTIRKLGGDQIGVRAYSTSIATISAYPHEIASPQEVARLPGCGAKIAELWHEWKETGRLPEADEAQANPRFAVIQAFYDIWGVGDATARDFYGRGWRDLDDVVEYGWGSLSRVQQIGVKYYDEFKLKIPRTEVESIADTILAHARRIHPDFQLVIVGGYRRGKQGSGDVDVVMSHPNESVTLNFVDKLVVSLEKTRHITHTLVLSKHNSKRGQQPVSWKGNEFRGGGFDSLDKALVVWQDPATNGHELRKRPHRRVDIIISPWKTVGCAVLGWSGETTFQRDLRRYCKKQKSYKFDSSGIRSRLDGNWVDLESGDLGQAPDMLTAERRVFQGLGLDWVPPEDRCTG